MPCDNSSSSSSSSSSSDSNYPCEKLTLKEARCIFADAVVDIASQFILTVPGLAAASVPATGLGVGTTTVNQRTDVIIKSNGFFILGHYIVCPASTVLLPPTLNGVANRYPFLGTPLAVAGPITSQMIRATRVLVTVRNVNGDGLGYVYSAEIVGIDGAGNVALLRINHKSNWNNHNPCIEKHKHPYFKWARSKNVKAGEKVYLIGDICSNYLDRRTLDCNNGIIEGNLAENRYLDPKGFCLADQLLVTCPIFAQSCGLPILDKRGRVIGMQTGNVAGVSPAISFILPALAVTAGSTAATPLTIGQSEGIGCIAGPSELFLRRPIKAFLKGTCHIKYERYLVNVVDPAGTYLRYLKGFAGIAYNVLQGTDYDYTVDYSLATGLLLKGVGRIKIDSNGNFTGQPNCKAVAGIRVLGLAGSVNNSGTNSTAGLYFVPGYSNTLAGSINAEYVSNVTPNNNLVDSPFLNALLPGDIITEIGSISSQVPVGCLNHQSAPALITWQLAANDRLEITYRRGGNALNSAGANDYTNILQENYNLCYTIGDPLVAFPALYDYPWDNINVFPLLLQAPAAAVPFPYFAVPTNAAPATANQQVNPQLPGNPTDTGFFQPAF